MADYISRRALTNALTSWQMDYAEKDKDVERFEILGAVIDLVEQMPTAGTKRGKWIKDGDAYSLYKCSVCNDFCTVVGYADCISEERMYKTMKYCPNCGAKMERSEE